MTSTDRVMYGYRQLKDIFKKNKWTLLIVIWTWVIVCLHLHYYQRMKSNVSDQRNEAIGRPEITVKNYDVLLNSYMRGGSTLSGIVLGSRDDTFYLYEPLWKIARWVYWRGNSTMCRSDRYECRHVEQGSTIDAPGFYSNKGSIKGSLVMAMKVLQKFYDCLFNDFENQVLERNTVVKLGGPSWQSVKTCIGSGGNAKVCLHKHAPRLCKNATHRVSKVLRLSTDLVGNILETRKNLKAFHLFRDPRAIINSRIKTLWYPTKSPEAILDNAKGLCDKMLYDFREGKKLLQKYPDRFKFLFYEDMNEEPLDKVKAMYRFVGMSLDEKLYPKVRTLPVFTPSEQKSQREKDTAFWWRTSLDWKIVQGMDDICADAYKELGYISIKNFDEFRNLSVSSVNLRKEYLLEVV